MRALTDRQHEVLDFIARFIDDHGYPPTIREIAVHFSISVKGAYDHVKALERKSFIRMEENRSRALEIVNRPRNEGNFAEVPLLGTVAAGRPILSEENFSGMLRVPAEMVRTGSGFALRVRGDSMKDAGILDGDTAVIEQSQTADDGEIVVAVIDDAVTLKRFYRERMRVRLVAENPEYPPIFTQDVRILGRLKGILRRY